MKTKWITILGLCALANLCLSGCASQQVNTKSSVMDYLYPKSADMQVSPTIPHLNLPLRVGVAFVPVSDSRSYANNFWSGQSYAGGLTEAKKTEILEHVADNFRGLDFVSNIEVIPSAYLTAGGSFANLSQIKTMYGIDVIALVSYDQVQFTDESVLSLSYWTIVGAYIVSGEKNDTNTLIDTVVYDIASQSMLFRAPGTSQVSGRSTPINLAEELRADSLKGFEQASINMVENLKTQLAVFKQRVKENPEQVKITRSEGYSGAGSVRLFDFMLLMGLLLGYRWLFNSARS
ncbi:rhombotarget lipoprotein [Shewanella aestuarii]|uniref:rhombotarget lipoprotein n=1 Tax=Shewanella aestuarii TaxID=1028752 RepID=UPI003D77E1A4